MKENEDWVLSAAAARVIRDTAVSAGYSRAPELVSQLAADVVELREAAALVPLLLEGDKHAAEEFRGWIARAADLAWQEGHAAADDEQEAPDHHAHFEGSWLAGGLWVDLFVAAVALARDDAEWQQFLSDIDLLFERVEWAEVVHDAALVARAANSYASFGLLAEQYLRQRQPTQPTHGRTEVLVQRRSGSARLRKKRAGKKTTSKKKPPGRKRPTKKRPPQRGLGGRRPGRPPRPRRPKRPPGGWRAKERRMCFRKLRRMAQQAQEWAEGHQPAGFYVYADGITGIVPPRACAGQTVVVQGAGFGAVQPANVSLMFCTEAGCQAVNVPAADWGDTQIKVTLPDWARAGCVGFFDQQLWDEHVTLIRGLGEHRQRMANTVAVCGGIAAPVAESVPKKSCPPCTGFNYFRGTIPEIRDFSVNRQTDPVVGPDETITISWRVLNADSFVVREMSGGPVYYDGVGGVDIAGSATISYALMADQDKTYRLRATNGCRIVDALLTVHVRRPVTVTIIGIELNQSIQRFDFRDAAEQNTVPLVEHKQTLVRVYLESSHPPDYNGDGSVGDVTGTLWVSGTERQPLEEARALIADAHDRESLGHSLNFVLGHDTSSGSPTLEVAVFSADPFARWHTQWGELSVSFTKIDPIKMVVLRVFDERRANRAATSAEVWEGLHKIMAAFPVAWIDGIALASTGDDELRTDLDYDKGSNWGIVDDVASGLGEFSSIFVEVDLLDEIEEVAEEFEDNGEIWCAVVPADAATANRESNGAGYGGGLWAYPKAAWLAQPGEDNMTPCHELGHAFGKSHSEGSIGDVAVDLRDAQNPRLMAADTTRIMFGTSQVRWLDFEFYYYWPGMPVPRLSGGGGF